MSDAVEIGFEPANDIQRRFMESDKRFLLMSGAVGAGKSLLGCWKGFILNLIYPGNRGLICRKELTSLKSSTIITLLEQVIPEEMIVKYDKSEGVLIHRTTVPHVNSYIMFSGLDKKADQQYPTKIGSTEYGWIFADETTELSEDDFQVLSSRLRYKPTIKSFGAIRKYFRLDIKYDEYCNQIKRQFFGATNPDGPNHYLYKFFFEQNSEDRELFLTTPYDNPHLDAGYIKALEDTLTGIRKERLLHGKWVQAEGLIYDNFDHRVHVKEIPYMNTITIYKKFFFGADANFPLPRAGVVIGVTANDEYHVLEEFYMEGAHISQLAEWLGNMAMKLKIALIGYHDPSAPDCIDYLHKYPQLQCYKANNKVEDGITEVYTLFAKNKLFINASCKNLIREIQGYIYKNPEKGEPEKVNDHACDALRYGLFTHRVNTLGIGGGFRYAFIK